MVPPRWVAQAAHKVGAIGYGQHALRQRYSGTTTATACRFGGVPSISGGAKDFIESVRAQTKFRCVGFANHDATCGTHARGHQAIFAGWGKRCKWRAVAGAKACHIR